MQDYQDFAAKNGIELLEEGACQFCGAATTRGVHECVELFSLGFPVLDFAETENHYYRFLMVDAHTLQHSEIHGRWNNHFHLTRQHLMLKYQVRWNYALSPQLSDLLKGYKSENPEAHLTPPPVKERGVLTITDVKEDSITARASRRSILQWSRSVYRAWEHHHASVDGIAKQFLAKT